MIDTHNKFFDFGKYKGERWTRVPVSYLKWLANDSYGERREMAESELKRRGTTIPSDVELSGHAIDRASQITNQWKDMGVYSWLTTIAGEAADLIIDDEVVVHKGFKFVFILGNHFPILKTIMVKEIKNKKQKKKCIHSFVRQRGSEYVDDNTGKTVAVFECERCFITKDQ